MTPDVKIYIDGYLMDVDDKIGKIATTIQAFSFLTLGSVKASFTNRISLPLTSNNRHRLEQIAPLSVITAKPYRNLAILIVQDGQAIIPSGTCQVTGIQERISLDIQSNIKGFFDAIEGKYLNDLDLTAWNGLWDNDRHDTVRNTTSGLVCPVTNNGQLVDVSTYVDGHTYGTAMIPFFYYHTIITQIFALAGYAKAGTIFADTNWYLKMAMGTRFVYYAGYLDGKNARAYSTANTIQVISEPNDNVFRFDKITLFSNVINGAENYFEIANDRYKVLTGLVTTYFRVNIAIRLDTSGGGSEFTVRNIVIYNKGVLVVILTGTSVSHNMDLAKDDYIEVYLRHKDNFGAAYNIEVNLADITITPLNTTNTDKIQATTLTYDFAALMPRILLVDFIKDFMMMFGLVMTEKNKVVTFKTWKEILSASSTSSVELAREDKKKTPVIDYNLTGYSQTNNFYWIVQADELTITDKYGLGKFILDNTTLPLAQDVYKSLFTASDQITAIRINQAAKITIYNQTTALFTKAADFGSRLILLRDDDGINFRFKAATSRLDYFIGYFIDKSKTYSLDWQELVNNYYPEYTDVLNRWTTVQQYYFITLVEAAQLDVTKLATRDGITYLIEQVENYVPNDFAKFKLIKR